MKKQIILIVSIIVALAIVFGVAIICNNDKDTNNTTTPTESISGTVENESTGDETSESTANPNDFTETPDVEDEMSDGDKPSSNLEHGEKDDDGRVYVDTDVVDIDNATNLDTFLGLLEIYHGALESGKSYSFVTDENEYTFREETYGIDICIRPSEYDTTFSEKYLKYDHSGNYIGYDEQDWEDGRKTRRFMERENEIIEYKFPGDGVILYSETINGITVVKNTHKVDDKSYHDYYKNNNKEITLTYDASGTMLVKYKYVDFKNGGTYDWVLDGSGYGPEHCISVTIGSKTYTGNEIPWGSIPCPPNRAGAYE